ncbi:hypothetical protein LUZ60_010722 [Juncus effusus]|nr:hypothetical protein LUZ60_010722 [Juncus effusus]
MDVVSLGTVVGWIVSPMIEGMIGKAQSYVSGQYKWSSEMMVDLIKLEDILTQILLVVGVAERRKIVDLKQAKLLRRIKTVVYEAEDVMDEFDYILLKEKAEKQKTLSHLASSSLSFGKRLVGLDEFRPKLKNVIDKLNRVKASAEVFLHVMGTENDTSAIQRTQISKMRVTNSDSHEEKIIGRVVEEEKLIKMLLEPGIEPGQNNMYLPQVISVVGDGGMGKTTLIQAVYNNEQIKGNFDLRIWVCVSENFEKSKLAKEILVAVIENKNINVRNYSYDSVQIELKKLLDLKKLLLVLDDVWYDENIGKELYRDMWKELFAIFKNKKRGSKILVTTRMKIVSELLGSTEFPLSGLKPVDGWSLLSKYAFGGEKPDDHPKLQAIGKKIVEKLGGSALAIKVIGGQLNAKFGFEEWNRILKKDLSKPSDIMTILRLSYEHLPEHLQRCFAYCSLFPKDWNLDSEKIVDMWIAHGFVHLEESDDISLENIGKDYFHELLSRSFLQQLK